MVADKVKDCTKCKELVEYRKQTVFGEGSENAEVVFIGEAPGEKEDDSGRPFVGPAGNLFTNILTAFGFKREDVYIMNILRCRPPRNRVPTEEEACNCRPFLDMQLKIIAPKVIVCMGNVAAQNLLGTKTTISRLRNEVLEYNGTKVICTFHPSYLLRNPSEKEKVAEDMRTLLQILKGDTNGLAE